MRGAMTYNALKWQDDETATCAEVGLVHLTHAHVVVSCSLWQPMVQACAIAALRRPLLYNHHTSATLQVEWNFNEELG